MTNPYYNHASGVPILLTRGVSSLIRDEFDLIASGFTLTQTAIAVKGAITGQSWTGAHDFSGSTSVSLPAATSIGSVSSTEIGYLDGVTSSIQTQMDDRQTKDADLTALISLSSAGLIARTADGAATTRTITPGPGCTVTNGDGVSGNPTVSLTPNIGLGDVLGPVGATDGDVALFDGPTGLLLKGSALKTIDGQSLTGSGNIKTGMTRVEVAVTTQTASAGNDYWLENPAATALTAPSAVDGDEFAATPCNGLFTNTIDFGSTTVRGPSGVTATGIVTLTLGLRMHCKYSSALSAWMVLL